MNRLSCLSYMCAIAVATVACQSTGVTGPSASRPADATFRSVGTVPQGLLAARFDFPAPSDSAIAAPAAPAAPTNLQATVSGTSVQLTWNGTGATSYVIEAGFSPGATDVGSFDTGVPITAYGSPVVPPGTYYVRVRGRNADGVGLPSNEVMIVVSGSLPVPPPTPPPPGPCTSAPAPPTVSVNVAGNVVTLSWPPSANATSYILEVGTASGASNLFNQDIGGTLTVSGTIPSGTFFARVRARNVCGVSAPSNEATITV